MFRKLISIALTIGLLFNQSGLVYAAGELNLSSYLSQMHQSIVKPDIFQPVRLRYFSYDSLNNSYKILLDKGDRNEVGNGRDRSLLEDEAKELMQYFFIGITLPNDTFWVNLRPDAPNTIIDPELEKTDIGRVFLEADLQLKKDTSSFTSPQTPEGKQYWDKLYKKAGDLFGSENITIPTLIRPWIVPNEVIVRETDDSAYVYKATLKVLLEEDYLSGVQGTGLHGKGSGDNVYQFSDPRLKELNEYSTKLIRETIIPKLTREVNSSKRYARLRQVYYSLILSRWFKARFSKPVNELANEPVNPLTGIPDYNKLIDSRNLTNLTSQEPWDKTTYFNQYKDSFVKGEYNIKESVFTAYGQSIRSYASGGIVVGHGVFPFEAVAKNQGADRLVLGGSFSGRLNKTFLAALLATGMFFSGNGNSFNTIVMNDAKEVFNVTIPDAEHTKSGISSGSPLLPDEFKESLRSIYEGLEPMSWPVKSLPKEIGQNVANSFRGIQLDVNKLQTMNNPLGQVNVVLDILSGLKTKLNTFKQQINDILETEKNIDQEIYDDMGSGKQAAFVVLNRVEQLEPKLKNGVGSLLTPREKGQGNQAPIAGLTAGKVILKAEEGMNAFLSSLEDREIFLALSPQGFRINPGKMIIDEFAKLKEAKSVSEALEKIDILVAKLIEIKKSYIESLDADFQNKDGISFSYTVMVMNLITLLDQVGGQALDADMSVLPDDFSQSSDFLSPPLTLEDIKLKIKNLGMRYSQTINQTEESAVAMSYNSLYNLVHQTIVPKIEGVDKEKWSAISQWLLRMARYESEIHRLMNEMRLKNYLVNADVKELNRYLDNNDLISAVNKLSSLAQHTLRDIALGFKLVRLMEEIHGFVLEGKTVDFRESVLQEFEGAQTIEKKTERKSLSSPITFRTLSVPIFKRPYRFHYASAEDNMNFVLATLERPVELYTFDNREVTVAYISGEKSDRIRLALGAGDRVVGMLVLEKKARILTNVSGKTSDINKALIITGMSEFLEADRDKEPIVINNELTSLNDDLLDWLNELLGEKILEKKDKLIRIDYSQAEAIVKNWQKKTGVSEILSAPYLAVDPPLLRCQKDVIIEALDAYGKSAEFITVDVLKEVMNEKLAANARYADNKAITRLVQGLTPADGRSMIAETLSSWIKEIKREEIEKDAQIQERDEFLLKVMKEYFSVMALKLELSFDEKAEQELMRKNDTLEHLFERIKEGNYFRPEEKAWLHDYIFKEGLSIKEGFLMEAIKIARGFLGRDTGYELPRERYKILSFSIGFIGIAASVFVGSSSALSSDTETSFSGQKRGGLDFTDEVMEDATTIEPRGSFAELDLEFPLIRDAELINLDNEFSQIRATIKAGIIPSGLRILEFIAACYQRNEFHQRLSDIIVVLNDACKLEELLGKESSPGFRRALLAPDMLFMYGEYASLN